MKYVIGKAKMNKSLVPRKLELKKNGIFDQEIIAKEFNKEFDSLLKLALC